MHIPHRGPIEWNLNTIVMLGGFIIGAIAWGTTWQSQVSKLDEIDRKFTGEVQRIDRERQTRRQETEQRWRDHDQLHKDRASDNAAKAASDEQKFSALDTEIRKIDNLTYRITVQEQGSATLARSVEELKNAVNAQATDLRVIREILQRLDPGPPRQQQMGSAAR